MKDPTTRGSQSENERDDVLESTSLNHTVSTRATEDCRLQQDLPKEVGSQDSKTDEVSQEKALTKLPRYNLGALFMPAIWGPAHGQWVTILFYPLWLFADIGLVNAVWFGGVTYLMAAVIFLGTAGFTIFFSRTVGQKAFSRVSGRMSVEQYLARERVWAVVSALLAIIFIAFATWYNLTIRIPAGPVQ